MITPFSHEGGNPEIPDPTTTRGKGNRKITLCEKNLF